VKKNLGATLMALLLVAASVSLAGEINTRTGKLLETMNAGGYTYMLLDTASGEIWVAGPETKVTVGETISVSRGMKMDNFTSETLKRTFAEIYFVGNVLTPRDVPEATQHSAAKTTQVEAVAKAAGGYTVAEILDQGELLDGKKVTVRGRVIKFTAEVMNTNWIHLQDGTAGDLTITTKVTVAVGDVIVASGILAADKDFGAGYKYDVIVEKATVAKE